MIVGQEGVLKSKFYHVIMLFYLRNDCTRERTSTFLVTLFKCLKDPEVNSYTI